MITYPATSKLAALAAAALQALGDRRQHDVGEVLREYSGCPTSPSATSPAVRTITRLTPAMYTGMRSRTRPGRPKRSIAMR